MFESNEEDSDKTNSQILISNSSIENSTIKIKKNEKIECIMTQITVIIYYNTRDDILEFAGKTN